MKKILLTSIIILIWSLTLKADLPGPAFQYDKYSENEHFYFKSIPFYNYDLTDFGKTLIYNSKTQEQVFKIDNYLPSKAFISNDGNSLVTTTYWMWGWSDFEDWELVKIYFKNGTSKVYYIDDLVDDKSKLTRTTSHTLWYEKMFVKDDTLNILTGENKVIRISLNDGKIHSKIKESNFAFLEKIKSVVKPKTKYYKDIKYPKGYIFPDLADGSKFKELLPQGLNKKIVHDYSDCKYYIMIYGTIDRKGNCEVFMLEANVEREENKEWEQQIKTWVTKQEYKTDLIPTNCDKWVFKEYFYLTKE